MHQKAGGYKILAVLLILGAVSCAAYLWIVSSEVAAMVGSTIQFGGYQWRVLDIQNGKALILSDTVIVNKNYHEKFSRFGITWEECSLREYLNGEFYNSFNAEEKAHIVETTISNNDNPWYGTSGGNATKDRIFLLSLEEVVQYFGDSGQLKSERSMYGLIDDQYNFTRNAKDSNGNFLRWWLRSLGITGSFAAYVQERGRLSVSGVSGGEISGNVSGGVRPALWLNLSTAEAAVKIQAPDIENAEKTRDEGMANAIISDLRSMKAACLMFYADHMDDIKEGKITLNVKSLTSYLHNPNMLGSAHVAVIEGVRWWVGYDLKAAGSPSGVRENLKGVAKSAGLHGEKSMDTLYDGQDVVWMIAR